MPLHQIQSPMWSLRKGCWTFAPFLNSGYASGWGGACGERDDDEDAWSGWGAGPEFVGRVGGVREVVRLLPCFLFWFVGGSGRLCLFSVALTLAGLEVVALGGVASEEGVRGLLARVP